MVTPLDKTLLRESSVKVDDNNIVIGITQQQTVTLKVKGELPREITIRELYTMLNPDTFTTANDLISLHDLRHLNAITHSSIDVTAKLDEIAVDLLKKRRQAC
jgi:hypothetical protein